MRIQLVGLLLMLAMSVVAAARGKKAGQGLATRWAARVDSEHPHPEYPRMQMVRQGWVNLNGPWEFAVGPDGEKPTTYAKKILVPFPPESKLSGVQERIPDGATVWYRRSFEAASVSGKRWLLHFGAVDWRTSVWVNGQEIGSHEGGFDSFSFDITDHLIASGTQEIIVAVQDPTDAGPQPRGKQVRKPEGIYYTPTTGIWQTVWLEEVPEVHFDDLKIVTHTGAGIVEVMPKVSGRPAAVSGELLDGRRVVATANADGHGCVTFKLDDPKWWSPERPFLYGLRLKIEDPEGKVVDQIESYFGYRTVSVGKGADGKTRLMLNGKATFMIGPLDQGFWPDGLYTPPTDDAMKYDIEVTKQLGFNMIRKHVKVEPDRWYYWCDRMGMLVWQDMPSGDASIGPKDPDIHRTPESKEIYYRELKSMIDAHQNHPSIVTWVLFNEGWGQFDTAEVTDWARREDPTRLLDAVTGWADRGVGDMHDWHIYPGPDAPQPEANRASVLGEYGGLGLPTPEHMWRADGWGYRSYKTPDELTAAFEELCKHLRKLVVEPGLSAAVYTQTTDVETELNGLMTYDREVLKMDEKRVRRAILAVRKAEPK